MVGYTQVLVDLKLFKSCFIGAFLKLFIALEKHPKRYFKAPLWFIKYKKAPKKKLYKVLLKHSLEAPLKLFQTLPESIRNPTIYSLLLKYILLYLFFSLS